MSALKKKFKISKVDMNTKTVSLDEDDSNDEYNWNDEPYDTMDKEEEVKPIEWKYKLKVGDIFILTGKDWSSPWLKVKLKVMTINYTTGILTVELQSHVHFTYPMYDNMIYVHVKGYIATFDLNRFNEIGNEIMLCNRIDHYPEFF
jgi:hypothetical protein